MINLNIEHKLAAKLLQGTITEEERILLDEWLSASPKNKQLLESLLNRDDMLKMYNMPRQHRDGRPVFSTETSEDKNINIISWLKRASIAACLVLVVGFAAKWWSDYSRVTLPELTESTITAMKMARENGRSDAQVILRKGNTSDEAVTVSDAVNVEEESGVMSLYKKLVEQGHDDSDMSDMYADIVTHHDKEFWMTLPDGSRVHLNYGSSLTYPLAFTGSKREVILEGEAYFFVTTDHRHPFVVHTRYGDVKEYGTEFCVNTRYNSTKETGRNAIEGKGMSVVLVKGSIGVITANSEYMMKPNDLALVTSPSNKPSITQVDTTPYTSWNTGVFSFEDCPFATLLDVIGKWHGKKVHFDNTKFMNLKFTGEIDRYESLDNILASLGKSMSADITIQQDVITVAGK